MNSNYPQHIKIKDYSYELPEERIAQYPLKERDDSKILIYKDGQITESMYKNAAAFLPSSSFLIFNETKVIHARLLMRKITGAQIEVFCLEPSEQYASVELAMQQTSPVYWKCMVGGAAKWKDGQTISVEIPLKNGNKLCLFAEKVERKEQTFLLKFSWKLSEFSGKEVPLMFSEVLHLVGKLPLPPYMHRKAEESDELRYQTIFAKEEGSVAAPTAALHFTPAILESFKEKGINYDFLTLHVGAGTFKPVKSEEMEGHDMHAEWMEISKDLIEVIIHKKKKGDKIIAVGTTSCRSLESLYWVGVRMQKGEWEEDVFSRDISIPQWYPYQNEVKINWEEALKTVLEYLKAHSLSRLITKTQIIIAPGYEYRVIDGIFTNFHQPQSTLLLLVAALIGEGWKQVYDYAFKNDFRFLSYGDGCLLWK